MAEPKKAFLPRQEMETWRKFLLVAYTVLPALQAAVGGLMVKEQKAEKCPMCGKPLEWGGADNG